MRVQTFTDRLALPLWGWDSQDKPPQTTTTEAQGNCGRIMQDKGPPYFVARICTPLLIPPVTGWHDMYSIYIFL